MVKDGHSVFLNSGMLSKAANSCPCGIVIEGRRGLEIMILTNEHAYRGAYGEELLPVSSSIAALDVYSPK